MNENLLTTVAEISDGHTRKLQQREDQIGTLHETLQQLTDWKATLNRLTESDSVMNKLLAGLPEQSKDSQSLRAKLQDTIEVVSQPQEHKHYHHFPKIAWVTAGLFLALCLVVTGWYTTASRLDSFRNNDTKYRYLQLIDNNQVSHLLHYADSLQQARSGFFRDSVLTAENEKQRRLEMLDEAIRKEAEAQQLRQKAKQ